MIKKNENHGCLRLSFRLILPLFAVALVLPPCLRAEDLPEDRSVVSAESTTPLRREGSINESIGASSGIDDEAHLGGTFNSNYVALFYGPSVSEPKTYQTNPAGKYDRDRPVHIRNFLSLGYNLTDEFAITPTVYWTYAPLQNSNGAGTDKIALQDPYLQFSYSNLVDRDAWNLYADFRVHFPVSSISRANKMRVGLQSFQLMTYTPFANLTFGLNMSEHYTNFEALGFGDDLALHAAPVVSYALTDTFALTVMYWAEASHRFGDRAFAFNNDGTALEPGLAWSITPNVYFNPYLSIQTGGAVSWKTTNIGALLNWQLL